METKKKTIQPNQENIDKLLKGLKEVTEKSKAVIDITKDMVDIKDILEADEVLDDKEIKSFGSYGAHIIVPSKYAGKQAKVIIKK